jgi:hypothetical protein
MVLRRCRRLLRDEDEALDVAQDVFVQLLRHRERLDGGHLSSLLFRIATNLSLNRLRDRRHEPVLPGDEVLQRIATSTDLDSRLRLDRLFGRHPERPGGAARAGARYYPWLSGRFRPYTGLALGAFDVSYSSPAPDYRYWTSLEAGAAFELGADFYIGRHFSVGVKSQASFTSSRNRLDTWVNLGWTFGGSRKPSP